jgi:hypothetical protein
VLDCERGDLDVGNVVAAQARRTGKLRSDRHVASAGRDEPDGGLP